MIYVQVKNLSVLPENIGNMDEMKFYTGQSGNFHVYETPEPATLGLLAAGAGMAGLTRRLRRKAELAREETDRKAGIRR